MTHSAPRRGSSELPMGQGEVFLQQAIALEGARDHGQRGIGIVETPRAQRVLRQAFNPIAAWLAGEHRASIAQQLIVETEGLFVGRSEEHTSALPSLLRISYAVFCLQNKTQY